MRMMDRAARSLTVTCAKAPNAFDDGDDRPTLVHDRRLGIVHWAACDVARDRPRFDWFGFLAFITAMAALNIVIGQGDALGWLIPP